MIPPEDQEREGGESAEAMGQLETLLLTLAGASLLALSSLAPIAVNKAASALRRKAKKAASDGMGRVDEAVSRDLAGKLVLRVVTELSAANKGAGKARAVKKAINDAKKEAQKGARETQRMARKMAACMVDDLNARFLREAARARAKAIGGRGTDGVGALGLDRPAACRT